MATRIFMPPESWRGSAVSKSARRDERQRLAHQRRGGLARLAGETQRQIDIGEDIGPGQQRRLLKHEADVVRRGRVAPIDDAGARRREAGDEPQRRGFAAARRAEQSQKLAVAKIEIEILERRDAIGEAFADPAQRDQRLSDARRHCAPAACEGRSSSPTFLFTKRVE
jgi:hypothetical protein